MSQLLTRPSDSAASELSKTNTSDGTNNGMGSRDGPSARRSKQNAGERSNQRAYHVQHQKLRLSYKQIDVNQTSFDCVCRRRYRQESAQKHADSSNQHSLFEIESLGADSWSKRVADIICTNAIAIVSRRQCWIKMDGCVN